METQEQNLTTEESLKIIQTMINSARNKVAEDGFHLILWGVLVISCCIANYIFLKLEIGNWSGLPWLLMPFIGVFIGKYYEKKRNLNGVAKSNEDIYISNMWLSYLFTLILVIVFCSISEISPVPFILIITGMVTFTTGKILQFKPLLIGGIVFGFCSLLCIQIKGEEQLLIQALAIFIGYIIPGVLLNKKFKKENNVQAS
jgi:hypothetical protein